MAIQILPRQEGFGTVFGRAAGQGLAGALENIAYENIKKRNQAKITKGFSALLGPEYEQYAEDLAGLPDQDRKLVLQSILERLKPGYNEQAGIETGMGQEEISQERTRQLNLQSTLEGLTPQQEKAQSYLPQIGKQIQELEKPVFQERSIPDYLKNILAPLERQVFPSQQIVQEPPIREQLMQRAGVKPSEEQIIKQQQNDAKRQELQKQYASVENFVNQRKNQPVQSSNPAEYGAAEAVTNNNPRLLRDFFKSGSIPLEQYIQLENLRKNQDVNSRAWNLKGIEKIRAEGEAAKQTREAVNIVKGAVRSGARTGWQAQFLASLGVDPSTFAGNTPTQILDKLLNEFVVQSDTFNSSRGTNFKTGFVSRIKPRLQNDPQAIEALANSFDLSARVKQERLRIEEELENKYAAANKPLPYNFLTLVNTKLDPFRKKMAEEAKEMWKRAGINIDLAGGEFDRLPSAKNLQEGYEAYNPETEQRLVVKNGTWVKG